jgi:hypothetical protein
MISSMLLRTTLCARGTSNALALGCCHGTTALELHCFVFGLVLRRRGVPTFLRHTRRTHILCLWWFFSSSLSCSTDDRATPPYIFATDGPYPSTGQSRWRLTLPEFSHLHGRSPARRPRAVHTSRTSGPA